MSPDPIRRLTVADADDVLNLFHIDPAVLNRELSEPRDYCWVGVAAPGGRLYGVHRSMRWGDHLLLKGLYVEEEARGGDAALRLAFALRDRAPELGYAGIAAWVEPTKPEAGLARLLRLREDGPMLHRFEVALPEVDGPATVRRSGTATLGGAAVHWVVDRHRVVLSGFPYPSVADHDRCTRDVAAQIGAEGVRAVEFPLPAADLTAALTMAGARARRLSRTPVRLGRREFA